MDIESAEVDSVKEELTANAQHVQSVSMNNTEKAGPYLLFMLSLSLMALIVLGLHALFRFDAATIAVLEYADTAVCALFFVDFLVSLHRAENRVHYFFRWGWLDLLSSVPVIDSLRWGRGARVIRILRVLRGIRSTKILTEFILRRRAESAFLAATLVSLLLVIISSIAILHLEVTPEANIKSPEDAIWWALATITTVGYGDRYPVTSEGRAIAALLMVAGVGLFGTLSGFVAAWFLRPDAAAQESETKALLQEVKAIREELARQKSDNSA